MLVLWVVTVFTFLPGCFCAPTDVPPFENQVHGTTTLPETNNTSDDFQYQTASISEDEGQSYSTLANKEDGNCESTTEDDGQYRPENFEDDEKFDDGSYRPTDYTTIKTAEEGKESSMEVFISNTTSRNETYTNESSLENVRMTRKLRKNNRVKVNTFIAFQLYKTNYGIENYDENADNGTDDSVRRFEDFEGENILAEKSDDGSYKPDAYPIEDYDEGANNGTYLTSSDVRRRRKRDFDVSETEEVQLAPVVFRVGPKKETPRNTTTGVFRDEKNIG